jgi:uncharacterized protein DUF1566
MKSKTKFWFTVFCLTVGLSAVSLADTAPRFLFLTINDDLKVVDDSTGLEWAQDACEPEGNFWQEALQCCLAFEHANQTDWRLPNVHELSSLIDEKQMPDNAINPVFFPDLDISKPYWTSTSYAQTPSYAWVVNFNPTSGMFGGGVDKLEKTSDSKGFVLCVRTKG